MDAGAVQQRTDAKRDMGIVGRGPDGTPRWRPKVAHNEGPRVVQIVVHNRSGGGSIVRPRSLPAKHRSSPLLGAVVPEGGVQQLHASESAVVDFAHVLGRDAMRLQPPIRRGIRRTVHREPQIGHNEHHGVRVHALEQSRTDGACETRRHDARVLWSGFAMRGLTVHGAAPGRDAVIVDTCVVSSLAF